MPNTKKKKKKKKLISCVVSSKSRAVSASVLTLSMISRDFNSTIQTE